MIHRLSICFLLTLAPLPGQSSPKNHKEIQGKDMALELLKKAAESGDPKAMYQLGLKIADPKEAEAWMQKSAEGRYGLAMVGMADLQFRAKWSDSMLPQEERRAAAAAYRIAVEKAFPIVLEWANRGDLDSMCSIGTGGYSQYKLTSPEEAMKWLRRAAEGGDLIASRRLGEKLLYTSSTVMSAEGFKWVQKAAEGGDFQAMLEMARKYTHGCPRAGLAPNPEEAMKWIEKAIETSGEPANEFESIHGLVNPYEAARLRGENPPARKERLKPSAPVPTERK